jgi:hypothetical protein
MCHNYYSMLRNNENPSHHFPHCYAAQFYKRIMAARPIITAAKLEATLSPFPVLVKGEGVALAVVVVFGAFVVACTWPSEICDTGAPVAFGAEVVACT